MRYFRDSDFFLHTIVCKKVEIIRES